jgi:hypothetical protein
MLSFSNSQLNAMLVNNPQGLIDGAVKHVLRHCYSITRDLDPISLRERVSNGLQRARLHGFTTAADLIGFVALMFEIGPNFDEHPGIRKILQKTPSGVENWLEQFVDEVEPVHWDEASKNVRLSAWWEVAEEPK